MERKTPATGKGGEGLESTLKPELSNPKSSYKQSQRNLVVAARITPDGPVLRVTGRAAWALLELLKAGLKGCTPIDCPAPRWSEYVRKLRHDYGLVIETVSEEHGGDFPGRHGRYVLRTPISIVNAGVKLGHWAAQKSTTWPLE
jgi:hypothetical protein